MTWNFFNYILVPFQTYNKFSRAQRLPPAAGGGRNASRKSTHIEGIAKLQFGAKSALFAQDSDSAQIAYSQSSISIYAETKPAQKSSDLTIGWSS
jgi:hypothetical protein